MNLVRCENGHFYDKDANRDGCPYCAQLNQNNAASQVPIEPENSQVSSPSPIPQPVSAAPSPQPVVSPAPAVQAPSSPPVQPLPEEEEDNCTVGYYSRVIGVEPVVGWLVCIEGEYRGESFKLKSGRNFIGRAANMDIVLSADHSVSRFKHASVIYEPRGRQFIVSTGESRELCYLNDEVVLSNMKMNAYDILNLGNTSLMLIPCCGERFTWETGIEKKPDPSSQN